MNRIFIFSFLLLTNGILKAQDSSRFCMNLRSIFKEGESGFNHFRQGDTPDTSGYGHRKFKVLPSLIANSDFLNGYVYLDEKLLHYKLYDYDELIPVKANQLVLETKTLGTYTDSPVDSVLINRFLQYGGAIKSGCFPQLHVMQEEVKYDESEGELIRYIFSEEDITASNSSTGRDYSKCIGKPILILSLVNNQFGKFLYIKLVFEFPTIDTRD